MLYIHIYLSLYIYIFIYINYIYLCVYIEIDVYIYNIYIHIYKNRYFTQKYIYKCHNYPNKGIKEGQDHSETEKILL